MSKTAREVEGRRVGRQWLSKGVCGCVNEIQDGTIGPLPPLPIDGYEQRAKFARRRSSSDAYIIAIASFWFGGSRTSVYGHWLWSMGACR